MEGEEASASAEPSMANRDPTPGSLNMSRADGWDQSVSEDLLKQEGPQHLGPVPADDVPPHQKWGLPIERVKVLISPCNMG